MADRPQIPDFDEGKGRDIPFHLKAVLFVCCFIVVTLLMLAVLPRHRGRVVLDPSIVQPASFPAACDTSLGAGEHRVSVHLLSVEREEGLTGVVAILKVRMCNPTDADLTTTEMSFKYEPPREGAPGLTWTLGERHIGSGFCDEYLVESPRLGELIRFNGAEGRFVVQGMGSPAVTFVLPDCSGPVTVTPAGAEGLSPTADGATSWEDAPVCVDDAFAVPVSNDEPKTAMRLADDRYAMRLCPSEKFAGLPSVDEDWFYYGIRDGSGTRLEITLGVEGESAWCVEMHPLALDVFTAEGEAVSPEQLRFEAKLEVTDPGMSDAVMQVASDGGDNPPGRYYLRVRLDKDTKCWGTGVGYFLGVRNIGSRPEVEPANTPTPQPTFTPEPSPTAERPMAPIPTRTPRPTPGPPNLMKNEDGTATDSATGLMWTPRGKRDLDWNQAGSYCSELRLGGYADWRLPTLDELKSLEEPRRRGDEKLAAGITLGAPMPWTSETTTRPERAWCYVFDGSYKPVDGRGGKGEPYQLSCGKDEAKKHSTVCVRRPL